MPEPRLLKLPDEIDIFIRLTREGFQYPEHPDWSMQGGEMDEMAAMVKNARRMWPLVSVLRLFSSDMRDAFYCLVYEEERQPVGIALYRRGSGSREWFISNVAVLPAFRRRGIARLLVEHAMEAIQMHGGEKAILDVIDGNLPALHLYQNMGFDHYSGSVSFFTAGPVQMPPPPAGFTIEPLGLDDWRAPYELAQRITPEKVQRYTPVREASFRDSLGIRLFGGLMSGMSGTARRAFVMRRAEGGETAAIATVSSRPRAEGSLGSLQASYDPASPELAPYLLGFALNELQADGAGRRVEFSFPDWQPALIEAAQAMGATRRYAYQRMGKGFQTLPSEAGEGNMI